MTETIVLSLGGSIINPGKIDIPFLNKFKQFVLKSKYKFVVVCGGGSVARNYMSAASNLSKQNPDQLGIQATCLNAILVASAFKAKVFFKPVRTSFKKIIFACGDVPGHSSDYDAVAWAKLLKVKKVINMTNVDYVYDKDPKYKNAKPLKTLSWNNYLKMIGKWKAGKHVPFDSVASTLAKKSKINVLVLNGKNFSNLKCALENKSFVGTVIE